MRSRSATHLRIAFRGLARVLVLMCVLAQVGLTLVRSGDRVLCFGVPHDAERDCPHHHHGDGCGSESHHHGASIATALPHEHAHDCLGCVDVHMPDDPSRPDLAVGLPPLPPPALVAIIELPTVVEAIQPPTAPAIEPRGIPPAMGLEVIRLLV